MLLSGPERGALNILQTLSPSPGVGTGQGMGAKGKELTEKCVWEVEVMQGDFLPFLNG